MLLHRRPINGGTAGCAVERTHPGFFPPVGLKSSHHQKCIQGIVGLAPQTTQPNNLYCPTANMDGLRRGVKKRKRSPLGKRSC